MSTQRGPVGVTSADVVIVGGGPAGATAAIVLARAGRRVLVIDKAAFPRDKCCGDGLTTLALRELEELGLTPTMVPNWQNVTDVSLRSPSGREVRLALPHDGVFAATAPRRELDAALLGLARDAGADVRDGHGLESIELFDDRVEVGVRDLAPVTARYVIAADGMWSPVRRMLGVGEPRYLGEWHAVRQYACNVTGPAANRMYVWFEPDLLPGYAWSFPLPGGRVNLGYGVPRNGARRGKELRSEWDSLLARPHIAAALGGTVQLEGRHTAWPIPAGIDRATLTHGRVLFVGDAAMATDTMTGEGIGQAVLTGRLVAEAISAAGALRPDVAAGRYRRSVTQHLVADHRMSDLLSRVLRRERVARRALQLADTNDWTRRNFARWMFEDEPRAALLTPRRWHRRFLHRPGAYRQST